MPITGHGFGLRSQNAAKSPATSFGTMTTLPCTNPGARPAVGPIGSPARAASRTPYPVAVATLVTDTNVVGQRRRGNRAMGDGRWAMGGGAVRNAFRNGAQSGA